VNPVRRSFRRSAKIHRHVAFNFEVVGALRPTTLLSFGRSELLTGPASESRTRAVTNSDSNRSIVARDRGPLRVIRARIEPFSAPSVGFRVLGDLSSGTGPRARNGVST